MALLSLRMCTLGRILELCWANSLTLYRRQPVPQGHHSNERWHLVWWAPEIPLLNLVCRALEPLSPSALQNFIFVAASEKDQVGKVASEEVWQRQIYCSFSNFLGFCNNDLLNVFCRRKRSPQNSSHLMKEQSNPLHLQKTIFEEC